MKSEWLDISVPVFSGMVHWPNDPPVDIQSLHAIAAGASNNLSAIHMSAHAGTHMDAPRHFLRDGTGIDTVPFDAIIGPCRVLEIRDAHTISPAELIQYQLQAGERLLFKTRNSSRNWENAPFDPDFVYIPADTARFLAEARVLTVGIDYLSVGGYNKDGTASHRTLLGAGIWIIEGLNLSHVQPGDYDLICLPLKLVDGDGAPARAVLRRRSQ
ncbi:MAG: cyclase family protein [Verrucomicrobiota bacterium]